MPNPRWEGRLALLLVALCHLGIRVADAVPQQMQGPAPGARKSRQLLVKKGLMLPPTVWNTSDLSSFDLDALTRAQVAAPHRPLTLSAGA
jgi:hypothetical protein